jgi:prepilin-type N-terminal cleavage/methylation domain-containing protein
MSNFKKQKEHGFTIVEILVVIVIIAILATIGIVSYNGVQQRSRAAAFETTVDQYRSGLLQYFNQNNAYPVSGTFCLGAASDYASGGCYSGGVGSAAVETALRGTMTTLPKIDNRCHTMYNDQYSCRRNLTLFKQTAATLDGVPSQYYLVYFLDDKQPCKLQGNVGGSWQNYQSKPNSSGYLEQDPASGTTMCMISMPSPET